MDGSRGDIDQQLMMVILTQRKQVILGHVADWQVEFLLRSDAVAIEKVDVHGLSRCVRGQFLDIFVYERLPIRICALCDRFTHLPGFRFYFA
jgi:Na+/H+ antiporter NhaB